ncbi:hypothetical protein B0H17DRAFT_1332350 [Mycena rosella]|uniref:Uncharacterized protein n=1 Tax=Mycena rosella TaxID=1033263 RepID=A0AAD7DDA5_MYCRO|nr:hypothetical protein B0H17DRAFT_1332350 [Mycena rosella]
MADHQVFVATALAPFIWDCRYKRCTRLCGNHSLSSFPFFTPSHHPFLNLIIMFFSASIAFTFVLSLSGIAVHSAPVAQRADFVPTACTGPNGTGTCTPLNVASPQPPPLPAINPAACTNVSNVRSLVLNVDNDCVSFPTPDCTLDFSDPNSFATEHFSDDSDVGDLTIPIASISCEADPGTVNGLFPQ